MRGTPVEIRNEKLGKTVVKALEGRNFEAYYCNSKEEALAQAMKLIPDGASVSWGGAASVDQIGLKEALREKGGFTLLDRDAVESQEEKLAVMRQGLACDVFLAGTNALSQDGQLVNIDGTGNRVAAMIFGPKSVVVIAGINKITATVEDAWTRARNEAAPINAQRFPALQTPCLKTGECGDCKGDSICAYIVTTRMCRPAKRIKVIVVGENLGF